jgi:thioredoxin 1
MSVIELSNENYETETSRDGIVLVDCWAAWCGPCKVFGPVYEKVAESYPDHVFAKLDTQAHKDLISTLGVEHIPTLLLYRDGILLFKQPGTLEEDGLRDVIRQAQSLDMGEVRAHLASSSG